MNWNPYARIRELQAELRDWQRSHEVLQAENYALADMVRELEAEVEDWQVGWGEAIRDVDDARTKVETYARDVQALQEEVHERSLNVVTGEWPG